MIGIVASVLSEAGLLPPGPPPPLAIGLTRGDTLWVDFFARDGSFIHVKVSDVVSLRDEAKVNEAAFATFGAFMPRPFHYAVRDGWEIIASEGVPHRALPAQHVLKPHAPRAGAQWLDGFFRAARSGGRPAGIGSHLDLVARLEASYAGSRFDVALAPWRTAEGRREIESLGHVLQHGDFVLNNLGIARRGLVVFDWEDFGKIALPGFDLCTLLVSAAGIEADDALDVLMGHGARGVPASAVIESACRSLGLAVEQFRRLVPLYLLAFLKLKEGYATAVQDRIAAQLAQICAAGAGRFPQGAHG